MKSELYPDLCSAYPVKMCFILGPGLYMTFNFESLLLRHFYELLHLAYIVLFVLT